MMPDVTVPPRPKGLPIASTQSPTLALAESPQDAAANGAFGSTFRSARSLTASRPMTSACKVVSSDKVTVICSALAITWLFVTMSPEGSMTNPEPRDATRDSGGLGPPGAPFSPKKSRKNSSSGAPGGGNCASGPPLGVGAALACVVDTLTTTPTSFAASWAKTSEKGVASGASAPLGAEINNNIVSATPMVLRRPKGVTQPLLCTSADDSGGSSGWRFRGARYEMAASLARRNGDVTHPDREAAGGILRALFDAALAAADPGQAIAQRIPAPVRGRTVLVGAGKASAAMACAFETAWSEPLEGLVLTRYGHSVPCDQVEVVEASHPIPDAVGEQAARRILALADSLGPEDQLVFLASGGGSALLSLPAPGLTLDDKREVTNGLLKSGATIAEINTVRKHLSAIKGGRLAAAAAPARIVTLAISDVPGDDPTVIASGPTVPDPTTFADARAVLTKYRIEPKAVGTHLSRSREETPKPCDPIFDRAEFDLVASPQG